MTGTKQRSVPGNILLRLTFDIAVIPIGFFRYRGSSTASALAQTNWDIVRHVAASFPEVVNGGRGYSPRLPHSTWKDRYGINQ